MTEIFTEMPLFEDAIYQYTISLEEQERLVTFYYNETDKSWKMDLKNIDGTNVALGIRMVPEYPILGNYNNPLLKGYFVLSTENTKQGERFFTDSGVMPQFYRLFHVYQKED